MLTRLVFCCAAIAVPAFAHAERIVVTSASATYFTATDQLEIVVTFDKPIDLTRHYFGFGGSPVGQWPPTESFMIRNDDSRNDMDETMEITHSVYSPQYRTEFMGLADYTATDRSLTFLVDRAGLGIGFTEFDFSATLRTETFWGEGILGRSHADARVIYTPEPASVVLGWLGVLGIVVHWLSRRPRANFLAGFRHGRNPAIPRAA